jgi:hypothetical protein
MRESETERRKDGTNLLTWLSVVSGAFVLVVAIYGALNLGEWGELYKWGVLVLLMLWPMSARFSWSEGGRSLLFQVPWAVLFALTLMVVFGRGAVGISLAVAAIVVFMLGRLAFRSRSVSRA